MCENHFRLARGRFPAYPGSASGRMPFVPAGSLPGGDTGHLIPFYLLSVPQSPLAPSMEHSRSPVNTALCTQQLTFTWQHSQRTVILLLIPITFLVTFSSWRGRKLHNLPKATQKRVSSSTPKLQAGGRSYSSLSDRVYANGSGSKLNTTKKKPACQSLLPWTKCTSKIWECAWLGWGEQEGVSCSFSFLF